MSRAKKGRFDFEATSSDDSDIERNIDLFRQSTRTISKPPRLGIDDGEKRMLFLSSSDDSQVDPYASNDSLDNYLPSPKKRKKTNRPIVAHQKEIEKSVIPIGQAHESNGAYDFNSQFDTISIGKKFASSSEHTSAEKMNRNAGVNVEHDPAQSDALNGVEAVNFAQQINAKLNEILARVAALEKAMIATTTHSHTNDLKRVPAQLHSEAELFMKSNALPTTNFKELKRFDKNLQDPAFYTATVR